VQHVSDSGNSSDGVARSLDYAGFSAKQPPQNLGAHEKGRSNLQLRPAREHNPHVWAKQTSRRQMMFENPARIGVIAGVIINLGDGR